MPNPFRKIEKILYQIRDAFWEYPEILVGDDKSFSYYTSKIYRAGLPYSHFVSAFFAYLFVILIFFFGINPVFSKSNNNTLIEGVVMGTDDLGRVQRLNKINPIVPSNIQLEKDLIELIYEPLIRYSFEIDQNGKLIPVTEEVLADEVIRFRQGADYQFRLKRGVKWHDGTNFNADDVIKTFDAIATLNVSNAYVQAVKQLRWEKIDEFNVRICTKSLDESEKTCNASTSNPIFSNFLELVSVKILPEHMVGDIDSQNINSTEPELFRSPIGTGKYKFNSTTRESITVVKNENYYDINFNPDIQKIVFRFYKTFDSAVTALQNGEVHTLAAVSIENLTQMSEYTKIETKLSPVISNQYWALYFNLRKDPNGNTLAPAFLSDVDVRKAISYALNKENIIQNSLQGVGEEAINTIHKDSEFFNFLSLLDSEKEVDIQKVLLSNNWKYDNSKSIQENIKSANNIILNSDLKNSVNVDDIWLTYNPDKAMRILESKGWLLRNGDQIRTNEKGEKLSFSLYFVNSFDRANIATSIKEDMARVGIEVITDRREQPGQDSSEHAPEGWSLSELNNQVLAPRLFDVILYGVDTFIDPNRYELFHSSQQVHPGLNLSGYTSTEETVKPRENRQEGESSLVRVPKVDRRLEEARRYDPVQAKEERISDYSEVQDMILDDMPVIFLYHPQFIYYHNKNLSGLNLEDTYSVEYRFRNVSDWSID